MDTQTINQHEIAEATLEGPRGKIPFRLFKTEACFQVVNDIFAGTTYPHVEFVKDVRNILDIGANIGAASVYFAMTHPEAIIYAFEPARLPLSLLEQNAAELPNVHAFPFGLYSCDKTVPLYSGLNDSVESSVYQTARTGAEYEETHLVSAPEFLAQRKIDNVDILKIDTEGCEIAILRSLEQWVRTVKVLYVEYHSDRDRRLIDEMLAETHVLWRGHVAYVHRGEFCYLRKDLVPSEGETQTCEILPSLDPER